MGGREEGGEREGRREESVGRGRWRAWAEGDGESRGR